MSFLMNLNNQKLNGFALQQLELSSGDRVLEVGFGGGASLTTLVPKAAFTGGVDLSSDAVSRVSARFEDAV
jgi:cyclopropane fatty-acyl-phospholipid synthase-like methyltransferase